MKNFIKQSVARYLAFWASWVIRERRPRIVGVTGSVGKTTTKEAIAAVLSAPAALPLVGLVGKSMGNLNTEIGLPLAVLGYEHQPISWWEWSTILLAVPFRAAALLLIRRYPSILVLEYAADRPGDIAQLVRLAPPEVAVVTAVGPAHLERFGSVARVAAEKRRLVEAVAPSGLVILGRDNHLASAMARQTHAPVKQVAGRGYPLAAAIAECVAEYFGLAPAVVRGGLKNFANVGGRLQMKQIGRWRIIDDTYNANPLSMELALDTLLATSSSHQRRVAILGDMRELGEESERYHLEVGRLARVQAELVIGVGPFAKLYDGQEWYPTARQAAQSVQAVLRPTDHILIKGSRGIHMEQIVRALEASAEHKTKE